MTRFKPTPGATPRPAPSALENLYRNTSTWLVARLRRRFGETLAEDIAQEAYVRMSRIDMDDVRHPKALLLKVAVNAGLSHTRRAASRSRIASLAVECDAAELDAPFPSEQDEAQLLKEIILGLPPLYRDVFLLSQFAGMPYAARSHSRPSGLSDGRRSQTQSEQRRALMLPQELLQLDPRALIVLTAGAPPVLGRKLAYYREPDFARRVAPPPDLPTPVLIRTADVAAAPDTMSLTEAAAILAADGLEPPPLAGAADQEVEAWVDRFLTATAPSIATEIDHAR